MIATFTQDGRAPTLWLVALLVAMAPCAALATGKEAIRCEIVNAAGGGRNTQFFRWADGMLLSWNGTSWSAPAGNGIRHVELSDEYQLRLKTENVLDVTRINRVTGEYRRLAVVMENGEKITLADENGSCEKSDPPAARPTKF